MTQVFTLDYDSLKGYLSDILSIENFAINRFHDLYDKQAWTEVEFLAIREKKDRLSCVVLENGRPVGFSIAYEVKKQCAHISRLAVMSIHGKKYSVELFDHQLGVFKNNNIVQCSVDLTIRNEVAFRFYSEKGFRKLTGNALIDYLASRNRDYSEYLGDQASHIAMIKIFI